MGGEFTVRIRDVLRNRRKHVKEKKIHDTLALVKEKRKGIGNKAKKTHKD